MALVRFGRVSILGWATVLATCMAAPTLANGLDDADAAAFADDQAIIVTGHAAKDDVTATKTPTPIVNVPQSIEVIDAEDIADRSLHGLGKALGGIPGVSVGQGEGHRDQIIMRGQPTTADFFVDGIRDDVQYYRGLYNVERIEILKGPNAMTFGRGGGGGVVNRVEKRAFDGNAVAGYAGIDTFGAWVVSADANQRLSDDIAGRLNATYESFDSNRDFYKGHRWAINPTASFGLGSDSLVTVSYEHVEDDRTVDRGVPSDNGRPLAGHRDTYFGSRQDGANRLGFSADIGRVDARFALSDTLTLDGHVSYGAYDKSYFNVLPNSAVTNGTVALSAYGNETQRENLFAQTNLLWEGSTGSVRHTLLVGLDAGLQKTDAATARGWFGPGTGTSASATVAVADTIIAPPVTYLFGPSRAGNSASRSEVESLAGYVQDQLAFGDLVEVILGMRYERFAIASTNRFTNVTLKRTDTLWSPRAGLVVHPVKDVSLYASYATSFLPQSGDQFSSIDATSQTLEPEKFTNYEIGAKWQARPNLLLTLAAYQLDRTNSRAPGVVPGTVTLAGSQRSKGIELGINGKIMPNWSIQAGAALQDAKIRDMTSAAVAGSHIALVPEFMASLWTRYNVNDRLGFGLGVEHQGDRFAQISNKVTLPAFTRVDAALYYKIAEGIEAQANIENLFNARYFPTAHVDNNIQPGAPLNARFSLRFKI